MDDRYGALINKFNRMVYEDVDKQIEQDFAGTVFMGVNAPSSTLGYLMGARAIRRAAASASQSQEAMAQFHGFAPYTPGVGLINDLAWRLNNVGVYVDPNQMAVLASNISATGCRLCGHVNKLCGKPGRKLALRADNVDPKKLNEVCTLVEFNTKGRRIDTTGLTVSQVGGLIGDRPLHYVEKATKLLAIYVIISDHTAPDFLCTLDI